MERLGTPLDLHAGDFHLRRIKKKGVNNIRREI
jgi:hypothetical protein